MGPSRSPSVDVTSEAGAAFLAALAQVEQESTVEPMAALFAEDAELTRLGGHAERGPAGAATFWRAYRRMFGEISSRFTHAAETPDTVVLEWEAQGTLADGRAILYSGASMLDIRDDRIHAFRTYYDSAAFLEPATAGVRGGANGGRARPGRT